MSFILYNIEVYAPSGSGSIRCCDRISGSKCTRTAFTLGLTGRDASQTAVFLCRAPVTFKLTSVFSNLTEVPSYLIAARQRTTSDSANGTAVMLRKTPKMCSMTALPSRMTTVIGHRTAVILKMTPIRRRRTSVR